MKKIYIVVLICMFPLFAAVGYAQVVEITGHVYERIGNGKEPIPGVTVVVRDGSGKKGRGALTGIHTGVFLYGVSYRRNEGG